MEKLKVVKDIVQAIYSNGVHEPYTIDTWMAEISMAYDNGLLWYEYEDDKLLGFIQGFRLHTMPASMTEAIELRVANINMDGDIGVIINTMVLGGRNTLRRLMRQIKQDNKEWSKVIWWKRKNNKFVCFSNPRRGI